MIDDRVKDRKGRCKKLAPLKPYYDGVYGKILVYRASGEITWVIVVPSRTRHPFGCLLPQVGVDIIEASMNQLI